MEFIISTDLEQSLPAVIDFNFDEMKSELSQRLTRYNELVVTEDSIKEGKADRAKLNKLKSAVEDRRKEVKRLCLAPYEDFECKCKELVGMIDTASGSIDRQVKVFEEQEKTEKKAALEALYSNDAAELVGLLPFERVLNPKWLNKGVSLPAAIAELQAIIERAHHDIKLIRGMGCDCVDQMVTAYLVALDMSAALAEKSRYEARQEQLGKMAPPTIRTVPGHAALAAEDAVAVAIDHVSSPAATREEFKTIRVIFHDTTAAFRADMKALTDKHNIRYGGIAE